MKLANAPSIVTLNRMPIDLNVGLMNLIANAENDGPVEPTWQRGATRS